MWHWSKSIVVCMQNNHSIKVVLHSDKLTRELEYLTKTYLVVLILEMLCVSYSLLVSIHAPAIWNTLKNQLCTLQCLNLFTIFYNRFYFKANAFYLGFKISQNRLIDWKLIWGKYSLHSAPYRLLKEDTNLWATLHNHQELSKLCHTQFVVSRCSTWHYLSWLRG